jgi:tetratricopeptide (TPR) repeat protein
MLRPKKKITKKELKRDPVLERIAQLDEFVHRQQKYVIYGLVGLVVIGVLAFVLIRSKQQANLAAMGELGLAEQVLANNDYDDAILRLEGIVTRYKKTQGAGIATLLLAQTYIAKNDWENALVQFEKYIDDYDNDKMLTAVAYNGLGIGAEQKGEWKKAAEYFSKAGKIAPYKFQRHEYYLNAARSYLKLEDWPKARARVATILADEPEGYFKSQAEELNAQLEALSGN